MKLNLDTKRLRIKITAAVLILLLWQTAYLKRKGNISLEATYCTCPTCGYQLYHDRGVPCYSIKCPEYGSRMVRI